MEGLTTQALTKEELIDRLLNNHVETLVFLAFQEKYANMKHLLRPLCRYEDQDFDQLLELARGNGLLTPAEEEIYDD